MLCVLLIQAVILPEYASSHPATNRSSNTFIPSSKLTFSTNLFHHSLPAPTWTAFSDYTGPDLTLLNGFSFYLFLFLFLFWVVW